MRAQAAHAADEQQADRVGSAGFRRAQQQGVAYFNAWLAARKGDYKTAKRETDRLTALVTPDANPRKMEPVHQLKGFVALYQGHNAEARRAVRAGQTCSIRTSSSTTPWRWTVLGNQTKQADIPRAGDLQLQ